MKRVFVGYRHEDSAEARNAVFEAINRLPDVEVFSGTPTSDTMWADWMARQIEEAACYIVVLTQPFGGKSQYLEREYDCARKMKKPIIPFLYRSGSLLPGGGSSFREKLERQHHCYYWRDLDELKSQVEMVLSDPSLAPPGGAGGDKPGSGKPNQDYTLLEGENPDIRADVSRLMSNAEEWLNAPNTILGGRSPNELIGTADERQVRDILRSALYSSMA